MFSLFQSQSELEENPLVYKYVLAVGTVVIILFVLYRIYLIVEFQYVSKFKKPLYNHFYLRLKKLSPAQIFILKNEFSFFKKLSPKHQTYFEHRVAQFIGTHQYIGKDNLQITDQMKVLVAATATMLTFGFRRYNIKLLNKVILYPEAFYSNTNQQLHKGEFNPAYNAIVFSWEDFLYGYSIENDNYNLAIHEFVHAIHIDNLQTRGPKAAVFLNSFADIADYLENNEDYKNRLVASKYFRDYAYTNQFEFVSVIIESFIETPQDFKSQFPEIYTKVKQMLNFNFAGY
ncbi:zinc-dependent peptidase [Olleya sp. YS]|uniref:zinc-dependent peptidase n=1 Tax=Olleya sp. YS TaxID=3028318 RepID=UPI00243457A8|nr:zinc-dependent peptidase [Olleya sp. YS]WGD35313.1 zinc-dependent peptidase [Olleya sp. YS]